MAIRLVAILMVPLLTITTTTAYTYYTDRVTWPVATQETLQTVYMDRHCGTGIMQVHLPVRIKLTSSSSYQDYMNCRLIVDGGDRMKVKFKDFRTERCCDFLDISEAYSGNGYRFAGTTLPPNSTFVTSGHRLYLYFRSDRTVLETGFELILTRYPSVPIRLVNGPTRFSGRVEVYYNGNWGTICDDSFDEEDAKVVCAMVGAYDPTNVTVYGGAHFGRGYGSIIIDELNCTEDDVDISDCDSQPWLTNDCKHSEDVAVECGEKTPIRLVNPHGTNPYAGRVEIYYQGRWGTVCSDNFDRNDARVICNMLGYTGGYTFGSLQTSFGRGTGPTIVSNLQCSGHEHDIRNCSSSPWLSRNCSHFHDAGVDCYSTGSYPTSTTSTTSRYSHTTSRGYHSTHPYWYSTQVPSWWYSTTLMTRLTTQGRTLIRLVDGPNRYSGRVEVYYHGTWGTVCDDKFDVDDARVICRMLGYTGGQAVAYISAFFGIGSGPIAVDDLQCQGYENDIQYCQSNTWLRHDCTHAEDAGVACYSGTSIAYPTTSTTRRYTYTTSRMYQTTYPYRYDTMTTPWWFKTTLMQRSTTHGRSQVRLVNGTDSYSGRVEVYYHGNWGTVCDDSFDADDARVICRMLGYFNGYAVGHQSAYYGSGTGPIIIDDLQCQGYENDIRDCHSNTWLNHNCNHGEDAGVDCYGRTQVRLVNGTDRYSGRVEVYYHGNWGTVCDDDFDNDDARVICRMLGYTDGQAVAYQFAYYGSGTGPIIIDNLHCQGYENDIRNCSSNWLNDNCNHREDAGVDCYGQASFTTEETPMSTRVQGPTQIRLVNGRDRYSGRVEVYYHGNWGTVCDDSFDDDDARVICRMLGYTGGHAVAYGSAYFGQGHGLITIDSLTCHGYEADIRHCSSDTWLHHDCSHSEDAGVDCYGAAATTSEPYYTSTPPWWYYTTLMTRLTTNGYLITDAVSVGCDENGWRVRVNMYNLRRLYPSVVASDIYLGDNSCTGYESGGILNFHQGLRQCLTSEVARNNTLVYSNQLVYAQHDPVHPFIIRNYIFTLPIECDVDRNETSIGHIHHGPHSVTTPSPVVGHSHYSVSMAFYRDPNFQQEIRGYPLQVAVGERVYVKVFTQTADWTVKMRVHTCYTKPSQTSASNMRLDIIKDGCEMDTNTHLISQSSHETRFVFQDFEYTSNSEGIYLFCDATFCDTNDYSNACLQSCNP